MSNGLTATVIAVVTFVCLLFYTPQTESSQVITRVGLTVAIVEDGSLTIDRWAPDTVDKALVDGHYYADKAPGLSLLAVPPVWITKVLRNAFGATEDAHTVRIFMIYAQVATMAVVGLPAAIAAALVYLMALRMGASRQGAVFGSLAIAIGSPFFYWSTTFFAHSLVGSLLIFMMALAYDREKWDFWRGLAIGLLAGYTVVVDFVGGFAITVAGVVLLVMVWRPSLPAHLRFALGVVLGAAAGAVPLLVYNYLAFGSPFQLGYMSVVGFEGMKTGFFGIGLPDPVVVLELLFGGYRGLLPLAPVLVLVPFGLVLMYRRPDNRPLANVIIAVTLTLFLINAGYYYWHGGWSTGPRHLVPTLPLLGLALAFALPAGRWTRWAALVLLAWGLVLSALIASTWVFADEFVSWPLLDVYLPSALNPMTWIRNVSLMLPGWAAFALLYRMAGRTA